MPIIKTEKILKELEKGSVDEMIEVFNQIKSFVTEQVQKEQQALEAKSDQLQSTLNRINGQ